jgi:hypothetical protein
MVFQNLNLIHGLAKIDHAKFVYAENPDDVIVERMKLAGIVIQCSGFEDKLEFTGHSANLRHQQHGLIVTAHIVE